MRPVLPLSTRTTRRWSARPRPRRRTANAIAGLLLLGLGCSEAPEPRSLQLAVPVHTNLRDMEDWRQARAAELDAVRASLLYELRTERFFVTELGRRVAVHELRAPGGAELEFGVRVWPWEAVAEEPLEVTLQVWPREGPPQRWAQELPASELRRGEVLRVRQVLDVPGTVEHAALSVSGAGGGTSAGAAPVAIVRPVVRMKRSVTPAPRTPRQVVLVTLDTVRRDALACYGHPRARTPNLDALARGGVLFEDAFSVTNVTNPAHTSLFTSLHLKDHQVRDNFTRLAEECPTLMETLTAAGFRTAAFVASFNFHRSRSDLGPRFQEFFDSGEFHERRAEDVNADLLPWLFRHQTDDFFAWVHYFDAHLPYDPPPPYDRAFEPEPRGLIELPDRDPQDLATQYGAERELGVFEARYLGEIEYLDAQVGELITFLQGLGLYDDAHVIVTADHGEAFGEQGIFCEHRGLSDAVTAIPLIWKPPGGANARRVPGLTSLLDVYPTLLDALDMPRAHPMRGQSNLPALEGRTHPGPAQLFAEHVEGLAISIRTDDTLGILGLGDRRYFPDFAIEANRFQLWSVPGPQGPAADRAPQAPDQSSRLRAEIDAFRTESFGFEPRRVEDERYRDVLERLGYIDPD